MYERNGEVVGGRFVLGLGGIRRRHGFSKIRNKEMRKSLGMEWKFGHSQALQSPQIKLGYFRCFTFLSQIICGVNGLDS